MFTTIVYRLMGLFIALWLPAAHAAGTDRCLALKGEGEGASCDEAMKDAQQDCLDQGASLAASSNGKTLCNLEECGCRVGIFKSRAICIGKYNYMDTKACEGTQSPIFWAQAGMSKVDCLDAAYDAVSRVADQAVSESRSQFWTDSGIDWGSCKQLLTQDYMGTLGIVGTSIQCK